MSKGNSFSSTLSLLLARTTMQSFHQFYDKVITIYQCFGVAPRRVALYHQKNESIGTRFLSWIPVIGVVICYWVSLIYCVSTKEIKVDLLSLLSHYIQLLLNAIALSCTLVSTVYNCDHFRGILDEFEETDRHLKAFDTFMDYTHHLKLAYVATSLFILALGSVFSFEYLVALVMFDLSTLPYWIVHVIPFPIYGMALHQAVFFIYCAVTRCRMVNGLLKKHTEKSIFRSQSILELSETDTMKIVYQLTVRIHQLCEEINGYFGITFLTSLLAMFAVSSIQMFYALNIISDPNNELKRNAWTFFNSFIVVILNIGCVSTLAYFAELLTREAGRINSRVRNLENELAIQYSSWMHPLLINIKISAFGFFSLNCTMLCGFFTAWITYLLILLQYNVIGGDPKKPTDSFGAMEFGV